MEIKTKTKPDVRLLNEMRGVLYDKKWAKTAPNLKLYYLYRGVKEKKGLRHNITVIPSKMLGKEFVKTKGHEHINRGEIYIVIEGQAVFLMQKTKGKIVKDVYAIKAKGGEATIVPRYYGHVTINPSKKVLKTGDWVSKDCKNDYSFFEKMQGACYYYTKNGWIKNKNYKKIPKLRFKKPLKSLPKNLDFLK